MNMEMNNNKVVFILKTANKINNNNKIILFAMIFFFFSISSEFNMEHSLSSFVTHSLYNKLLKE